MTLAGKSASVRASRGWETRRQNDERVAVNLPPDFLPLWDRIKLTFRGTPEERCEKFLQYAYEHGTEVEEAIDREAEGKLAREIAAFEARTFAPPGDAGSITWDAPSADAPFETSDLEAPVTVTAAWVEANVAGIATAFGVPAAAVSASLDAWRATAAEAARLEAAKREAARHLQAELDRARLTVTWGPGWAKVDLGVLRTHRATSADGGRYPTGSLVVVGPGWFVAVPLAKIAALVSKHTLAEVTVDPDGVNVTWPGNGSANLPSQAAKPEAYYLHLPPAPFACAA